MKVFHKNIGNKKIIILGILIIFLTIIIFLAIDRGVFMSDDQKDDKIAGVYITEGFSKADVLIQKYYGNSSKAQEWYETIEMDMNNQVMDKIVITDNNLKSSGNYYYYDCSIKNNTNLTLSYIEIDVYVYDNKGNMIDSTWTNWSGTLPPDGTAKLETMIEYDSRIDKYNAKVSDYSIK